MQPLTRRSPSTLGPCQPIGQGTDSPSCSTTSREPSKGLGWPSCSVCLCWSLVGCGPPLSQTHWQAASQSHPNGQPGSTHLGQKLLFAVPFPPACLLPSPDALTWAFVDPQMTLSSGHQLPSQVLPSLTPSGAPPMCCMRCPPSKASPKMVPSGPPQKVCSLPENPSKCPWLTFPTTLTLLPTSSHPKSPSFSPSTHSYQGVSD